MTPVIDFDVDVLANPDALVPPAFWHCPDYAVTIGDEVGDLMRLFGYAPNPEQQLLLDGTFGMDRNGRLTAFEVFVLASRQNLKTGFMIQKHIGKALLLRRPMQIWTAHKESATDQAFAEFQRLRETSEEFAKRVLKVSEGKGSKSITFRNGCTIVFRPRTGKAGQSMSADDLDEDEYFAVEPKHEGSLVPTLSTRPNAQIGKASSAPHAGSNMQRAVMMRGRMAALGMTTEPRLLYAEWSVMRHVGTTVAGRPRFAPIPCAKPDCTHVLGSQGCIADRREVIKLANPSAGRSAAPRIGWDFVESERRALSGPEAPSDALAEWLKERLSIGVEHGELSSQTIFGPPTVWQAASVDYVADGVGAIGIAQSADKAWISLCGASLVEVEDPDDEEAEPVDVVLVAPILRTDSLEEAIAELQRIQSEFDCQAGLDEGGPGAADLIEELEDQDVAIEPLNLSKYAAACARFKRRITADPPTVRHLSNLELDTALRSADWKWVGDNQVIARRAGDEALDTDMLEAAVIAAKLAENGPIFDITRNGVHA